jgi:hypothetical protein
VRVTKKERPRRPANIDIPFALWSLIEECWAHDPRLRPNINYAYSRIVNLLSSLEEVESGHHLPRWTGPPNDPRLNQSASMPRIMPLPNLVNLHRAGPANPCPVHATPSIHHTAEYVRSTTGNDLTYVVQVRR